jgi:hypothetical protein
MLQLADDVDPQTAKSGCRPRCLNYVTASASGQVGQTSGLENGPSRRGIFEDANETLRSVYSRASSGCNCIGVQR